MDFKQLKSFVTVVKENSFTKAANILFTSQSTVSAHIQQLEAELNVCLFIRTTKSIEITEKGKELYRYALDILEMRNHVMQMGQEDSVRVLHIGTSTVPAAYFLPKALVEYQKKYPEVKFEIHQSDSQNIVAGIQNGVYEIGLVGVDCESDSLSCIPICEDRMVLITPYRKNFAAMQNGKKLSKEQIKSILAEYPVILREKGSGSRKSGSRFLESIGIMEEDLGVAARMSDQLAILRLVEAGIGIAILSEKVLQKEFEGKKYISFYLEGEASIRNLYIVCRKNQISKDEANCLTRCIQSTLD